MRAICIGLLAAAMSLATAQPLAQVAALQARINDAFAAALWRISVDTEERVLAVGMANNAVATYSLEQAEDRSLIHLPLGLEENHRAHPVAVSPDGALLAYAVPPRRDDEGRGVFGTATVRILSRRDGRQLTVLSGLPTRAQDLKFAPDGTHLAAVLSNGCGLRVWSAANWALVARDDEGYAGPQAPGEREACTAAPREDPAALPDTYSVVFTSNPMRWLLTAGGTGVRSYRRQGEGVERVAHGRPGEIGVQVPDGLAVSPDGRWLAVGDHRLRQPGETVRLRVVLLAADTLARVGPDMMVDADALQFPALLDPAVAPGAEQFNLARVAWLRTDGADWLLAGGALPCVAAREKLLIGTYGALPRQLCAVLWRFGSKDPPRFLPVGSDQLNDVVALPRRGAFVTLSNRRLQAVRPDGRALQVAAAAGSTGAKAFVHEASAVDLRDIPGDQAAWLDFALSPDASILHFVDYGASVEGRPPRFTFDIDRLELDYGTDRPAGLSAATTDEALTGSRAAWVNQTVSPTVRGMPIAGMGRGTDIYRAAAWLSDSRLVLVSANFVRVVGAGAVGNSVLCSLRIQSEGFRVNASRDGRWIVVGHGDGVVRWYGVQPAAGGRACRLDPRLALHISRGSGGDWNWVAWRSDTGSFATNGRVTNPLAWQIPDELCDTAVVGFNALIPELFDREAVRSALRVEPGAVQTSGTLASRVRPFCDRTALQISSPRLKARVTTSAVEFTLQVHDSSPTPRSLLVEHGNGTRLRKEVDGRIYAEDSPMPPHSGRVVVTVHLPPRLMVPDREFNVCFVFGGSRQCHPLLWGGGAPPEPARRLWAVLIGVGDYGRPEQITNLRYAPNDAVDLARLFVRDRRHALDAGATPEFAALKVDLLVAAPGPGLANDSILDDLRAVDGVQVHAPSVKAIREVLERVAQEAGRSPEHKDLVIFHFSGHGQATPTDASTGHSALLLPDASDAVGRPASLLSSAEIIRWLSEIHAEKILVVDACSTLSAQPGSHGFDGAKLRGEFEQGLPSAHLMLSGHPGQTSRESSQHAFDRRRGVELAGNGLFSYALLRSVTDPQADTPTPVRMIGKIVFDEAKDYIEQYFQDQAKTSIHFRQTPWIVPARTGERTVIRRLDDGS